MNEPTLRLLSLGAGVQSTALFLLACEGILLPKIDGAIFADTQWEPRHVMDSPRESPAVRRGPRRAGGTSPRRAACRRTSWTAGLRHAARLDAAEGVGARARGVRPVPVLRRATCSRGPGDEVCADCDNTRSVPTRWVKRLRKVTNGPDQAAVHRESTKSRSSTLRSGILLGAQHLGRAVPLLQGDRRARRAVGPGSGTRAVLDLPWDRQPPPRRRGIPPRECSASSGSGSPPTRSSG